MRHDTLSKFSWVLVALLAWSCGVRADEKSDGAKHPAKYKAHVHHKALEFDLSKADHREALMKHLDAGEVEELELQVPITPMAIFWEVGLWTIVVFVLLLLILRKMAWGPMLEGLQKREATIRSAVDEAKKAREETQRVSTQFQQEMAQKMAEIPKLMEEARRDAEQLKEEIRSQATKDIQAERQRLRREIDTARDQALQDIWTQAAQLATLISAKAIGRALTAEDHTRLIDEALIELRAVNPNHG